MLPVLRFALVAMMVEQYPLPRTHTHMISVGKLPVIGLCDRDLGEEKVLSGPVTMR